MTRTASRTTETADIEFRRGGRVARGSLPLAGGSLFPSANTDHELMDSEHRVVLDWAQEGAKRLREAHPAEQSLYAVDVLAHLARSHFVHEQIEMRGCAYPNWLAHGQDHERLLAQLALVRQSIVKAAAGAAQWPAHERLSVWMHSYIAGHDRRYARWLAQWGLIAASAKPRHAPGTRTIAAADRP